MSSFEIEFAGLWTYKVRDTGKRLPLNQLSENGGHVHGLLELRIDGNLLPRLGYCGPDDVCFNEWVFQLKNCLEELRVSHRCSYTYDEGEQGQPAFLFEREGGLVFISIIASPRSDGLAHPQWQRVQFTFSDFKHSVLQFLSRLQTQIEAETSAYGKTWWLRVTERDA